MSDNVCQSEQIPKISEKKILAKFGFSLEDIVEVVSGDFFVGCSGPIVAFEGNMIVIIITEPPEAYDPQGTWFYPENLRLLETKDKS